MGRRHRPSRQTKVTLGVRASAGEWKRSELSHSSYGGRQRYLHVRRSLAIGSDDLTGDGRRLLGLDAGQYEGFRGQCLRLISNRADFEKSIPI